MSGISPLDEYPIHQAPLPVAWANSSDRNFYDRSYFNAHDRTGEIFVITGLGYYPNLGTKDAFVLVPRGEDADGGPLSATRSTTTVSTSTSATTASRSSSRSRRSGSCSRRPTASPVDLTWDGLVRRAGAAAHHARRQSGHPGRAALRAARHVGGHDRARR